MTDPIYGAIAAHQKANADYDAACDGGGHRIEMIERNLVSIASDPAADLFARHAFWREEWKKASARGFQHCTGVPGAPWLKGEAAKLAHYAWAEIPPGLVKQWDAERRSTKGLR